MEYQTDDLIYDIEIRKNLFVLTQFYPRQQLFIISYLEGSNKLTHLDPKNDHYEHGDLLSSYNATGREVLNDLAITTQHHASNEHFIQMLSQKYQNQDTDAVIKAWLKPFTQSKETHQFLIDYINQENPSLKRTGNNHFRFENLANPIDFARFAARYGLASTAENATQGWSDQRLKLSASQLINDPRNLFNFNRQSENLTPIDYYYPLKDLDIKAGQQPSKPMNGLRIGYNSMQYDETMIAHLLTAYINHNNFFNLMPEAWQYYQKNYQNTYSEFWNSSYHDQNLGNSCFTNYQAWLLCAIKDFYQNISYIMPSQLTTFNSQMFANRNMSRALGWRNDAFYTKKAYDVTNRYIDLMLLLPHPQPLKQVAGMFGFQIKESSSNNDPNKEMPTLKDMADVIAYNISDVYVTHQIFQLSGFQSTYKNRNALINQYEVLNYQHDDRDTKHKMTPATGDPTKVRFDRVTVNNTNPRIMENIIAPYPNTKLVDKPVVDFMYPAPSVAKQYGVKPFDVLEDTMKFAKENIPNGQKVFQPIYDYYKQFRGKNFNREQDAAINNQSKIVNWNDDRVNPITHTLSDLNGHANLAPLTKDDDLVFTDYNGKEQRISHEDFQNKVITQLPVQNVPGNFVMLDPKDHSRVINTRGWYNVSVGGIHGAEEREDRYQADIKQQNLYSQYLIVLKQNNTFLTDLTPDEILKQWKTSYDDLYQNKTQKFINGLIHKLNKNDKKKIKASGHQINQNILMPTLTGEDRPVKSLITFHKNGNFSLKVPKPIDKWQGTKTKKRYLFTSTGKARHQDFSSYYPTLTVRLQIAINVDGVDQYENIYTNRLHNKAEAKNPKNPPEVRKQYKIKQAPQKLLLNSLTGIADIKGMAHSKVRVNNRITQMRIIGQLFAWRIGQALALEGAKIVSNNTDGLYASNIDEATNDRIVKEQTKTMLLKVGPEEVDNFISANSNNRLEYTNGKIQEAKGGTLTAWKGPLWDKTLSHPALNDHVLAQYLAKYQNSVNQEFDRKFAKQELFNFRDQLLAQDGGIDRFLVFLQWVMRSNRASHSFIFTQKLKKNDNDQWTIDENQEPDYIEQTNRIFLITPKGQQLLNPNDQQPKSLFKATASSVSTKSGVITHIKDTLQSGFADSVNMDMEKINDLLANWKPDVTALDFVDNDKLINAYINDFDELDDELHKQELYSKNNKLALQVLRHYLSHEELIDVNKGIWGRELESIDPEGQLTRDKILDCKLAKIDDFPENHFIYINNRSFADYPETIKQQLIENVDYDAYIDIIQSKFEHAWQN